MRNFYDYPNNSHWQVLSPAGDYFARGGRKGAALGYELPGIPASGSPVSNFKEIRERF
jgi:hypothetical protein